MSTHGHCSLIPGCGLGVTSGLLFQSPSLPCHDGSVSQNEHFLCPVRCHSNKVTNANRKPLDIILPDHRARWEGHARHLEGARNNQHLLNYLFLTIKLVLFHR